MSTFLQPNRCFRRMNLKRFRELAALAGAALARSIRDSIPVTPPDALSWWLATLWWSNPPLQEEVSKKEQCLRLVSHDPFQDSIRLIEDLKLSTDSPKWPVDVTTNDGPSGLNVASPELERTSRSDTPKKSQKKAKRRLLDCHAKACIKEHKDYVRLGERLSMRDIVTEYVAKNVGVSHSGTYRRLTDNSDQWST